MDLVFGTAEIAGALYMCPTSAGTACATASVAVGLHGFDTASAGLTQLITGEEALPYGVQLLMNATGLDQDMATLAYDLVAIGFELNAVREIAAQGTEALVKQYDLVFDSVENTTLSQHQVDDLLASKANGETLPDPSSYMSQSEIDAHLAQFSEGAVRFSTRSNLDEYGTAGGGDAFVMPKSEFDQIVADAGGDMSVVEQRLNLDTGSLSNGDAVALYIPPENLNGIRVPNGNEAGANSQWVPGGYTASGTAEAVVDLRDAPIIEIEF